MFFNIVVCWYIIVMCGLVKRVWNYYYGKSFGFVYDSLFIYRYRMLYVYDLY